MKHYIGLSCGFHDAALSIVNDRGEITFAGHAERYSQWKHDENLNIDLIQDALSYVGDGDYCELHYYERPLVKAIRQIQAGQDIGPLSVKKMIGRSCMEYFGNRNIKTHNHHLSHAAAGFQTSPYKKATVVIIDAIGETDTISIWDASYVDGKVTYKYLWGKKYPDSIGLLYSAMTARVGLRPLDEEYILMGMAAYGNPKHLDEIEDLLEDEHNLDFTYNLHRGVPKDFIDGADDMDIAASTQKVTEQLIKNVMRKARSLGSSKNLVYGGGVALNCLANKHLGKYFSNIWIMPNPGDAGSSLGAAALGYKGKLQWNNAYLGYEIKGPYPTNALLNELCTTKIVGVANGRAEFGPRALGNRSLLADPRGSEIKDLVNEIKQRQKFRPFAPVILEEEVHKYFVMPINWTNSRYMQVVARCKFPKKFPAIVHADGTSRVQTVPKDGSGIRELLEAWNEKTGCPMLLNTSLNVKGSPMVNNRQDADRFEREYNVKVYS